MAVRTFIVRPFGEKKGIDFDRVQDVLIGEALDRHGIKERTTLDILASGNIRTEMFRRLLIADLVIADLSIHNANVFYELGIRHALRRQHTIMIRSKDGDDFPFDLFTDRYLSYDYKNLESSVDLLTKAIEQTLRSTETDSPVFLLMPNLPEPDPDAFITVPTGFSEAVGRAAAGSNDDLAAKIGDLALLADDIRGFSWETNGLRIIGRAQFKLGTRAGAAATVTWERVRESHKSDVEANQILSTTYQRQGDLASSDQAIDRVLSQASTPASARSEAYALRARNAKSRWIASWSAVDDEEGRARQALGSAALLESHESYYSGYMLDLSNYYPGINALGMAVLAIELAARHEDAWTNSFSDDAEADRMRSLLKRRIRDLTAAVCLSVEAQQRMAGTTRDLWAEVTLADLTLYRGDSLARVTGQYGRVAEDITPFQVGAVRDQLELFRNVGVFASAAEAALNVLPAAQNLPDPRHTILFTGHRIDSPGRKTPRFPAAASDAVAGEIQCALDEILASHGNDAVGVAGAASGGDILFHEACLARGIPSTIYLALPPEGFAARSVEDAGPDWVARYYALLGKLPNKVLHPSGELPAWLAQRPDYTI
jgi:hypothetical protein